MQEELREFIDEDRKAVARLAARAFAATQMRFVVPGKDGGEVILIDGKLVGCALLRIIRLPSGSRVGFIAWLMTDPNYRRRGLARKLVSASLSKLHKMQCDVVLTDVEGYNTDSANIFYRSGFRRVSLRQQLRFWRPLDLLWIWIKTGFSVDPGHFLWVKDARAFPVRGSVARLGAVIANTALATLAFSVGGGVFFSGAPRVPTASQLLGFFLGVGSLLGARELGMQLVARFSKQPLAFRCWSGGWGAAVLIAIGFGSTFPLPGNNYPRGDGWNIRDYQKTLGKGAILGVLLVGGLVLLGGVLRTVEGIALMPQVGLALQFVGKPLLIFDTIVAVAPFEGFHSRHLRDYHQFVWLLLSAFAIFLFVWG